MRWISDRRIWIDFETKEILENLCEIYVNRENLLCQIISKWTYNEEKKCDRGYGFKDSLICTGYKISRIYLNIDDYVWNNFVDICNRRELDVSSGFKSAIFCFANVE